MWSYQLYFVHRPEQTRDKAQIKNKMILYLLRSKLASKLGPSVWKNSVRAFASESNGLSYYHNPDAINQRPLVFRTIGRQLELSAAKFPNSGAVVSQHENLTITFPEVLDKVSILSNYSIKCVWHNSKEITWIFRFFFLKGRQAGGKFSQFGT